jgi:hypothetical protein
VRVAGRQVELHQESDAGQLLGVINEPFDVRDVREHEHGVLRLCPLVIPARSGHGIERQM